MRAVADVAMPVRSLVWPQPADAGVFRVVCQHMDTEVKLAADLRRFALAERTCPRDSAPLASLLRFDFPSFHQDRILIMTRSPVAVLDAGLEGSVHSLEGYGVHKLIYGTEYKRQVFLPSF